MTRIHILAILLMTVLYGVAGRPTEMAESVDARVNPIEQSGNSFHTNRFRRADQTAQSHNGIRYNGMTIKLPEGEGFVNQHLATSTEKTNKKPVNRMARIHIRIG